MPTSMKAACIPGNTRVTLPSTMLPFESTAIDLEVTSNRPDCLGHIGVAREVSVIWGQQDAVIKPIRGPIREIRGIAGATKLGDGTAATNRARSGARDSVEHRAGELVEPLRRLLQKVESPQKTALFIILVIIGAAVKIVVGLF